jgi:hypothetical protein
VEGAAGSPCLLGSKQTAGPPAPFFGLAKFVRPYEADIIIRGPHLYVCTVCTVLYCTYIEYRGP